jgi:glutamate-1-semialdehyde 2,1-aminomutase
MIDEGGLPTSRELNRRLSAAIPGGAHTYAKGEDQFPEGLAPVLVRGRGAWVWDADGNGYLEYGSGLRSVTLGHGHPEVVEAVAHHAALGTNFVRPSRLELDVAEQFLDFVGNADMVKFTKDGSSANTAAVKLARAYTGRSRVAICTDHPFYSYDDWAMVVTPLDAGIPLGVADLTLAFRYDDLSSVTELFEHHPEEIACVMLEVERTVPPSPGYLQGLADLCRAHGALLVFDECVTGFRWGRGGAQKVHGVQPDLTTWGKGMANGFALSALAGRREVMELGGLDHDRERVFLLSTTHGAEHVGLAAGASTMNVYAREPVIETLAARGRLLRELVTRSAREYGVDDHFRVVGHDSCLLYETRDADGVPSQEFRTLFLQESIRRGLLAPSFVVSYAHTEADIRRTAEIVDDALRVYRESLEQGVESRLVGRPVRSVYRRYNHHSVAG